MTIKIISKKILYISIPASVQFIVRYIQISTDLAFIGHYSTEGWSAIQNARAPYFLFLSFFLAFTNGTNILVAQALGAKLRRKAKRIAEVSLFYNQLISFGYLFFWLFFGKTLLALIGAKGEMLELSADYVRILSFTFVLEGAIFTSNAIFQGRGKTLPVTISSLIRTGLNIPLDWCLIYGHWGFPEMGISGAALATTISEISGGLFIVILLFRTKEFPIFLKHVFRPVRQLYGNVVKIGLPNGLEFMIWSLGNTGLVALLNALSKESAGYFGVTNVIKMLNMSIYFGLGVATVTLVGMAVGAKNYALAKRSGLLTLYFSFGICVVVGLLYVIIPNQILGIFTNDTEVISMLAPLLGIVSLTLFPQAFNVVGGNSIRARGDTKWLLKTQTAGTILIIPLAYLAMFTFHLGLAGLLWVILFDEIWRALVNYARLRHLYKKEQKEILDKSFMPAKSAV
jgi:putative MATE family efflux protein